MNILFFQFQIDAIFGEEQTSSSASPSSSYAAPSNSTSVPSSCPEGDEGLECRRAEARRSVDCPRGSKALRAFPRFPSRTYTSHTHDCCQLHNHNRARAAIALDSEARSAPLPNRAREMLFFRKKDSINKGARRHGGIAKILAYV